MKRAEAAAALKAEEDALNEDIATGEKTGEAEGLPLTMATR